jgi:hypothetical protein
MSYFFSKGIHRGILKYESCSQALLLTYCVEIMKTSERFMQRKAHRQSPFLSARCVWYFAEIVCLFGVMLFAHLFLQIYFSFWLLSEAKARNVKERK